MKGERAKKPRTSALEVPVDWEALEEAFELNTHGVRSYLHRVTGTVLRVVEGMAEPGMLSRIGADADYVRIEAVSSRVQYAWMEEFIPTLEDPRLKKELAKAIQGKGAFRRFKDALAGHEPEQGRWFAFRSDRLAPFIHAWLDDHALNPVGAPVVAPPAPPSSPSRRARSASAIRETLYELAEDLSPRDLQALVAFAAFVRARSIASRLELARGT